MCVTRWRAVEMKRQVWLLSFFWGLDTVSTHPSTHQQPNAQTRTTRTPHIAVSLSALAPSLPMWGGHKGERR
uniref:Putative secreted protein n=1 Tax=Anopheles marajoara TaxID=58244 RepID=A0A2M4CE32_9DIPT